MFVLSFCLLINWSICNRVIISWLFLNFSVTPFSLFDDDDEEEEEAGDREEDGDREDDKNEADLKGVLVKPSGSSAPAALLSEKLQVGEISLVPTDPT